MQLPAALVYNLREVYGDADADEWLLRLPALIETCAMRWRLMVAPHFPGLSYNYVAPATRDDGLACALKLGPPNPEMVSEHEALRIWGGHGCARLIGSDLALGAMLIEHVRPGGMLTELAAVDDDAATSVAADVMRALWRPAPATSALRPLDSWTGEIDDLVHAHRATGTSYPSALVDAVASMRADLLASQPEHVTLHGDCHHFNILRAERAPWLAIDPKGLVGERAYEIASFLYNPDNDVPDLARIALRRIDIFCERLALDRQRLLHWAVIQAALSAWWSHKADGGASRLVAYALRLSP
jgi:streptomycin 6-kinase